MKDRDAYFAIPIHIWFELEAAVSDIESYAPNLQIDERDCDGFQAAVRDVRDAITRGEKADAADTDKNV